MAGKTFLLAALGSLALAAPLESLEERQSCAAVWYEPVMITYAAPNLHE